MAGINKAVRVAWIFRQRSHIDSNRLCMRRAHDSRTGDSLVAFLLQILASLLLHNLELLYLWRWNILIYIRGIVVVPIILLDLAASRWGLSLHVHVDILLLKHELAILVCAPLQHILDLLLSDSLFLCGLLSSSRCCSFLRQFLITLSLFRCLRCWSHLLGRSQIILIDARNRLRVLQRSRISSERIVGTTCALGRWNWRECLAMRTCSCLGRCWSGVLRGCLDRITLATVLSARLLCICLILLLMIMLLLLRLLTRCKTALNASR